MCDPASLVVEFAVVLALLRGLFPSFSKFKFDLDARILSNETMSALLCFVGEEGLQ